MAPAADLKLPPPKVAPTPSDAPTNPKAATVEDVDELTEASSSAATASKSRFTTGGIIYPPPDIRTIVDKTATFVARNGTSFEQKIKGDERANTKFAFLNESDPYHAYYKAKIQAVQTGEGPLAGAAASGPSNVATGPGAGQLVRTGGAEGDVDEDKDEAGKPAEPRHLDFVADLPNITAVDLDILKLTALFTARKGRSFASALQAREGRSYQFEFLRPSHSLFGFYNRLVEQYRLVMEPTDELLKQVRINAYAREDGGANGEKPILGNGRGGGRMRVLEEAKKRGEWEAWVREKRKKQEDEDEKDRALFNSIDWQDFVVVGTVELTEADAHVDLPPPMSLREVENMTMAQRRMAAMIMEVEGGDEEEEQQRLDTPQQQQRPPPARPAAAEDGDDMEMDESDDESSAAAPAPVQEVRRADGAAPIKIRKDYVPKTLAERKAAEAGTATTVCPVCKETVALKDMDEHVRIELLNPAYRAQRQDIENRRSQHNALLEGADPSRFLKEFAGARTDIFGAQAEEEARKRREEEAQRQRREREKIVWDGHANSRSTIQDNFNRPQQVESSMAAITKQYRLDQPKVDIGPQIGGQGEGADAAAAGVKRPAEGQPYGEPAAQRQATDGTSIVAAPTGPRGGAGVPPGAPHGPSIAAAAATGGYGSQHVASPYAHFVPATGPPAVAAPPPPQHRPSPQVLLPPRADGSLYPENEWQMYHPHAISLRILLPDAPSVSPKCDGRSVTFENLPPSATMGSVRDRVHAELLEGSVGASKLKLKVEGRATTLKQSLAHWNLKDGDEVVVSINK